MFKMYLWLFLVILLSWFTGMLAFIAQIPSTPSTDASTTDAVVVLTGGALRMERGFALIAEGRAPRLFISGVETGLTVSALLRSKDAGAASARVTPAQVTLGYQARSTLGNAEEIAVWALKTGARSLRVVTGSYHMPRSLYELHVAAPALTLVPEPVFPGYFEHNAWWQSEDGIRLVLSEYNKYLVARLWHRVERVG